MLGSASLKISDLCAVTMWYTWNIWL